MDHEKYENIIKEKKKLHGSSNSFVDSFLIYNSFIDFGSDESTLVSNCCYNLALLHTSNNMKILWL